MSDFVDGMVIIIGRVDTLDISGAAVPIHGRG